MRNKFVEPPPERRVAALAAHQHGVITRVQLVAFGLDGAAIGRRVRAGRLHRVYQGVYAVGHPRLTREGRFMAAVLACGDGAALSHFAAAVHLGLRRVGGPRIDVTVPTPGGRRRRGALIVHRAALDPAEVTVKDGIPVTTPARTLTDLADVLPRRQLERAIDEAAFLRLDLDELRPLPGRRGRGLLAGVLARHTAGSTRTRTRLEERMLELCRRFDLPPPEVNVPVEGYTADFLWREARLIVETDGWQGHGTRAAFEHDRRRDAALTAAGWHVVRITWKRLEREPEQIAGQLASVLARLLAA